MSWKSKFFVFLMVASFVPMRVQAIIYVDAAASGSGYGTSWANAYVNLKAAVDASPANSEIWVAVGTYYPSLTTTVRTDSIVLKPGMKLYGGFLSGATQCLKEQIVRRHTQEKYTRL